MPKKELKVIYENKTLGVIVEEAIIDGPEDTKKDGFIVKHGLKEMCPTEDKTLALIFAKGYERGFAEGKKDKE